MRTFLFLLVFWPTSLLLAQSFDSASELRRLSADLHGDHPAAFERLLAGNFERRVEQLERFAIDSEDQTLWQKAQELRGVYANGPGWRHGFQPAAIEQTVRVQGEAGSRCEQALPIDFDQTLSLALSSDRSEKSVWVVFSAPAAQTYTLSTMGSASDTRIELWQSCAQRPGELLGENDDYAGLQSVMPLPADRGGQQFYARISVDDVAAALWVTVMRGGSYVSGTVSPVPTINLRVSAISADGYYSGSAYVNGNDGTYQLYVYYDSVRVRLSDYSYAPTYSQWIMEAYPDRPCFVSRSETLTSCGNLSQISLLDTSSGAISGIDFNLQAGGEIAGTILNAGTLEPLSQAQLHLSNQAAGEYALGVLGSQGRFRITGLPDGQYYLQASAFEHVGQLHAGVPCDMVPCEVGAGTPIVVSNGNTQLVNFALDSSLNLVINVSGIAPSRSVDVRVTNEYGADTSYAYAYADTNGNATVRLRRSPGLVRFYVAGNSIVSQVYPQQLCVDQNCAGQVLSGELISVPAQGQAEVTIAANRRPSVVGTVVDEISGAPVTNATVKVRVAASSYSYVYSGVDANGAFNVADVYPGSYVVHAESPTYVDELYNDIPCQSNNPTVDCPGGVVLNVNLQNPPPVAFQLRRSAVIAGQISVDGAPPSNYGVSLALLGANNQILQSIYTSYGTQGLYELTDLIPGSYRVGAYSQEVFSVIYDGVVCDRDPNYQPFGQCTAPGTTLTVASGEVLSGIDFYMQGANGRLVKVRRGDTGSLLAGVALDSWTPDGQWINAYVTDAQGLVRVRGSYSADMLMSTSNTQGLVDEVYDNISCPNGPAYFGLCSLAGALPVASDEITFGLPPLSITLVPPGSDALWVGSFED